LNEEKETQIFPQPPATLRVKCNASSAVPLKAARAGKGGKIKSHEQAIAIGLSKARKKGNKVPRKK
jgi:hypothetical protein